MEVSKNGRVSKVPARSAFTIQPIPGAVVADNNRHMAIWFESGDKEAGAWEGWCEESGSMGVDAVLRRASRRVGVMWAIVGSLWLRVPVTTCRPMWWRANNQRLRIAGTKFP